MSKSKRQHEADILGTIRRNPDIVFVSYIFNHYTDISRQRFYQLGLDKLDTIREAIEANKERKKNDMLTKWMNSDNPTLQIAAFRMLATDDERRRLNQQYIESRQDVKVHGDERSASEILDEIDRLGVLADIAKEEDEG